MAESTDEHQYGRSNRAKPVEGADRHNKKADYKANRVVVKNDEEKSSAETPDPNVESLGNTLETSTDSASTPATVAPATTRATSTPRGSRSSS